MLKKKLKESNACQQHQDVRRDKIFVNLNQASRPGEAIVIDFIGPLHGTYILTKNDYFRKLVQFDVYKRADASVVVHGLNRWINTYSVMKTVISDGGRHFVNHEVRRKLKNLGIQH